MAEARVRVATDRTLCKYKIIKSDLDDCVTSFDLRRMLLSRQGQTRGTKRRASGDVDADADSEGDDAIDYADDEAHSCQVHVNTLTFAGVPITCERIAMYDRATLGDIDWTQVDPTSLTFLQQLERVCFSMEIVTVNENTRTASCTCSDYYHNGRDCPHILAVLDERRMIDLHSQLGSWIPKLLRTQQLQLLIGRKVKKFFTCHPVTLQRGTYTGIVKAISEQSATVLFGNVIERWSLTQVQRALVG